MNSKALLGRLTRKIKAACLRLRDADGLGRVGPLWEKTRRRLRFLRWTLVIQLLKGAAFAGGGVIIQIVATRYLNH
ncbi:hypothetical protein DCW30_09940 [Streptomyces alfalfae]|uniref:Uncharacterized protein n=1 Tax=Streptomyces alfalfae TaxID=1642299 RepID=A0ABM6GTI1_9ACTN|nr:hypothetical protein [Streptomyces alfalfae]APY87181.1 hypothetical protein A7J05_16860 [Streptomyces alfalfae]AYA17582.1 hypothetical protein D3X13_16190 [Streptomyces fradiae]RXX44793.1 hypothetical protein DCW30_09940 [Streptomyces alfalfae]RZM95412.1 hypothetical protein D4104_17875 [Streptomyces alfalfae]